METYLTINDVAEYLKFSKETIQRWVQDREIPFYRIRKRIRFRLSDLEKWIAEGGVNKTSKDNRCSEKIIVDGDLFFEINNREIS